MNPLDRPLEDVIAHTIVADLMGDDTTIREPEDFAVRAALDGFRQGVELAAKVVAEMAADHDHAGEEAVTAVLREAVLQIRTLPKDLP